jgi:hypothetical protein
MNCKQPGQIRASLPARAERDASTRERLPHAPRRSCSPGAATAAPRSASRRSQGATWPRSTTTSAASSTSTARCSIAAWACARASEAAAGPRGARRESDLEAFLRAFTTAFLEPHLDEVGGGRRLMQLFSRELLDPHLPPSTLRRELVRPVREGLVEAIGSIGIDVTGRAGRRCIESLVAQLVHVVRMRQAPHVSGATGRADFQLKGMIDHIVRFSAAGVRACVGAEPRDEGAAGRRALVAALAPGRRPAHPLAARPAPHEMSSGAPPRDLADAGDPWTPPAISPRADAAPPARRSDAARPGWAAPPPQGIPPTCWRPPRTGR